jgi:hypothetical protein
VPPTVAAHRVKLMEVGGATLPAWHQIALLNRSLVATIPTVGQIQVYTALTLAVAQAAKGALVFLSGTAVKATLDV